MKASIGSLTRCAAVIVLIGAMVAGLVACAPSRSHATPAHSVIYVEPNQFNSLYPPSGGYYPNGGVLNNIADRLLWQDPETMELHPWIAEELPEVNEDSTEFTFRLRRGVTYSDGSVLDAHNVKANYDLYAFGDENRQLTPSEQLAGYSGAEMLDDYTIRFTFDSPYPGFPQATSSMNQALLSTPTLELDNTGFSPGNATAIAGSGPFYISGETLGTELVLSAREDYDWAPPARSDHQGPAQISEVRLILAAEDSVRIGALIAGQADIARSIEAPDEKNVLDNGVEIHSSGTNGVNNSYHFRFQHPLLSDIRVRQAIIHAIDRENILRTLYSPSYPIGTSILAQDALGYKEQTGAYVYDPEEAHRLLDEAGWELADDGVRTKDGQRLSLTFNEAVPQPRSREMFTKVQENLRSVGIEANLFPGDRTAQNAAMNELDQVQVAHSMVGRGSYEALPNWVDAEGRDRLLNEWNDQIGDPELQGLVDIFYTATDTDEQNAAVRDIQDYLTEQAYVLPMFEEPQVYGYQPRVEGFTTEAIGRPSFYAVKKVQP